MGVYKNVIYTKADSLATITLNRPHKLNAISLALSRDYVQAIAEARQDPEVKVVIVKGAGRAFSAGHDFTPGPEDGPRPAQPVQAWLEWWNEMLANCMAAWNIDKPVLGQVHGYCLGAANDIAMSLDIVVASEDCVFGHPPVRTEATALNPMWTYLLGPQWAKRMLLTGDSIDAKTAAQIGWIYKAVPADKLEAEVNQLAQTMVKIPSGVLACNKRVVNRCIDAMGLAAMCRVTAENNALSHMPPEASAFQRITREKGLKAALEWRDGQFGDYRAASKK